MRRAILIAQVAPGRRRSRSSIFLIMVSSLASVCGRITSIAGGAARRNAASLFGAIIEDAEKITIGVGPFVIIFIVGGINSKVGTISPGAPSSPRLVVGQGGRVSHGRSLIREMTGLVIGG